jgi:hypothetical protein
MVKQVTFISFVDHIQHRRVCEKKKSKETMFLIMTSCDRLPSAAKRDAQDPRPSQTFGNGNL